LPEARRTTGSRGSVRPALVDGQTKMLDELTSPGAEGRDECPRGSLDTLFKSRYHGAANIRGIRYQILYSVLRGFDLYDPRFDAMFLRLEGIEDLDLIGARVPGEYIQAKYSEKPWTWSSLKRPLTAFLHELRADPDCHLVLVVSFELHGEIAKLADARSQCQSHAPRLQKRFRRLCVQAGASKEEADQLYANLTIQSVPEDQILEKLRLSVTDAFGLGSEAVETYINVLVAKFVEWAEARATVTRADLDQVRIDVGEALSRETEFEAYGRGLIDRIPWELDEQPDDFFNAKATRPGHIAGGLDIRRETWLDRINAALMCSSTCVLRSSSGQGKSTLMYRYAREHWPPESTYILRAAESPDQVALVANYLRFKAHLGLPILLLVDNAGLRTRLWPAVAQECAALGVRVLVTTRTEDWYRFARESLTGYEVLEPTLQRAEARQLFVAFQGRGQLHASVTSPDWAYEKIGHPHLLMEYIYLLTHGHMLEERLRDQIAQFSEHGEDPAKIHLIRKAALADALGVSLSADGLLAKMQLMGDPQRMLDSLAGEYLTVQGGLVTGLHWVRSLHLSRILHEGYPNPAHTAVELLQMVDPESIRALVAAALCWQGCDTDVLMRGLAEKARDANLAATLQVVDGVFEGGCQKLFDSNRDLFDEAFELVGPAGPLFLATAFTPVGEADTLDLIANVLEDERGDAFRQLKSIAANARRVAGGVDWARRFLTDVVHTIGPLLMPANLPHVGRLLSWCATCSVSLPAWHEVRDSVANLKGLFDLSLNDFCAFALGVYAYDQETYVRWFEANREDVLGYLKANLDCIGLEVSDNTAFVQFVPDPEAGDAGHSGAIWRLTSLRSALPLCEHYRSRGVWLLPFGLRPSHIETDKDLPQAGLALMSDVEKNRVWHTIVESHYLPDSFHAYQDAWYRARSHALHLTQLLSRAVAATLEGKAVNVGRVLVGNQLPAKVSHSLQLGPDPPSQTPQPLRKALRDATREWGLSTRACIHQLFDYMQNPEDQRSGNLAVYNMRQATKDLSRMHGAFQELFLVSPDYFAAASLDGAEATTYVEAGDLLELWILDPPRMRQRNIRRYLSDRHQQERREAIDRVREATAPLRQRGIATLLPSGPYLDHPLRFFPLTFSVSNPCYPERDLAVVLEALSQVHDVTDFFCLVPTFRGARILQGGYQFSSKRLAEASRKQPEMWESLVPHALPRQVWDLLPDLPLRTSPAMHLRANVAAVLGMIPMAAKYRNVAQSFSRPQNRWETELQRRYLDRLRQTEVGIAEAAAEVRDYLKETFPGRAADSSFATIHDYLAEVESAARDQCIDETVLFNPQLRDRLDECIEDLVDQYL